MKLLLIDDEDDIRLIARLGLRAFGGFEVLEAASGAEGVRAAVRERPDVILLDVMMPGMDGPSTLAALRANPAVAGIPVIFLTAKAMASELEYHRTLGAAGVLTKPFDPVTLAHQVHSLL